VSRALFILQMSNRYTLRIPIWLIVIVLLGVAVLIRWACVANLAR